MIMAWGLESNENVQVVKWVMESLFPNNLIVGLGSLLEWVAPRFGFDYSEYFVDWEEGLEVRCYSFLWWPMHYDQGAYKAQIIVEWDILKRGIQ